MPRASVASRLLAVEPYAIVFLASGTTLILEIVAARILAPYIGVSVYTWTSIIGVILAGISLGNWTGGVFADRWGSRTMLGLLLLLGAAATVVVPVLTNWVPGWVGGLPILWRIVLLTLGLFFVPSFLLAMVSPVVIKLTLRDLNKAGSVAGRIYAVSTAGAILGTFLTGFVLVQAFGSQPTVFGLAAVLAMLGVVAGRLWRPRRATLAGIAVLALAGGVAAANDPLRSACVEESSYYCIKVIKTERDGVEVRELILDQLVHSYIKLDDPTHLEYGYQKLFAELVLSYVAPERPEFRALFVGGGGYELPRYLETVYPESRLEVIEIDPAVTQVAHDELGFRADTSVVSYNEDARMSITERPLGEYDIVVGDAFNDVSVPWHLTTREFNEEVRGLLRPGGFYTMNIVDAPASGRFLRAVVLTLRESWPHVYVLNQTGNLTAPQRSTTVVVASDREINETFIRVHAARVQPELPVTRVVAEADVDRWMGDVEAVVLTDDFAPVDNYLAPLYLESR